MNSKAKSYIVASIITAIFMIVAIQPGIINMIGYTICISIFGENSGETIQYEKTFIYSFDILLGLIVFIIAI